MHLTDDISFQQELMISFLILIYVSIIRFVIYLFTGLFKLSRISFPAAGFRLEAGLGEECIGALVDYPWTRSPLHLD